PPRRPPRPRREAVPRPGLARRQPDAAPRAFGDAPRAAHPPPVVRARTTEPWRGRAVSSRRPATPGDPGRIPGPGRPGDRRAPAPEDGVRRAGGTRTGRGIRPTFGAGPAYRSLNRPV